MVQMAYFMLRLQTPQPGYQKSTGYVMLSWLFSLLRKTPTSKALSLRMFASRHLIWKQD